MRATPVSLIPGRDGTLHRRIWRGAPLALLALVTLFELRILRLLDAPWVQLTAYAEQKVVLGQALMKAYQNRLLGTVIIDGLARSLGLTYQTAHGLVTGAIIAATNLVIYRLFVSLTRDWRTAMVSACTCIGLFVGLHDQRWLYVWDCIDAAVFALFAYGVFARRGVGFFAALFAVEILNREAALFIALWLVLDAVGVIRPGLKLCVRDRHKLASGVALMAVGALWTVLVREAFWTPPPDRLVPVWDVFEGEMGNQLQLIENVKRMAWSFTNPAFEPLVPVLLVALGVYFWRHRRDLDGHTGRALILLASLVTATLTLGVVHEVRIFHVLIPFVVAFHLTFTRRIAERRSRPSIEIVRAPSARAGHDAPRPDRLQYEGTAP